MEDGTWLLASAGENEDETHMRKGPWTVEEDMELIRYINLHGDGRWSFLAKAAGLKRTGKSCRLRWVNYLRPDLKRGNITPEEECLIIKLHGLYGNRWSRIAQSLPGRTDNEIKNYWRTRFKRKMNVQVQSCSSGMEADNRVHIERSTVSSLVTASFERAYDLDSAEPSTNFTRQNSDDIMLQTNTTLYLQDDISSQAIPISERNYDYGLQGEISGSFQINDDGQPSIDLQDHSVEESHNHWLPYNFLMCPLVTLQSSEFFADGASQDGNIPTSSCYMVASPEPFYDDDTYLNYSDVLWNMDDEDDRLICSPHSLSVDDRRSY